MVKLIKTIYNETTFRIVHKGKLTDSFKMKTGMLTGMITGMLTGMMTGMMTGMVTGMKTGIMQGCLLLFFLGVGKSTNLHTKILSDLIDGTRLLSHSNSQNER